MNNARDLLRQAPVLQNCQALQFRMERERRPEILERLRLQIEDDARQLQAMREAIKELDPIERKLITARYFSSQNVRCTPWRSVFVTVYGSDSQAHQRAGYRAHRAALDKLEILFSGAGLLDL